MTLPFGLLCLGKDEARGAHDAPLWDAEFGKGEARGAHDASLWEQSLGKDEGRGAHDASLWAALYGPLLWCIWGPRMQPTASACLDTTVQKTWLRLLRLVATCAFLGNVYPLYTLGVCVCLHGTSMGRGGAKICVAACLLLLWCYAAALPLPFPATERQQQLAVQTR